MYKNCKRCNIEKEIVSFCKNQSKKDGLEIYCRECNKEYKKEHYIKNKKIISEKHKIYYLENKKTIIEKVKEYSGENKEYKQKYFKDYYLKNKQDIIEKVKEYNIENKESRKYYLKEYNIENREKLNTLRNIYNKNRKNNDPLYKLTINIRSFILSSLKTKGYIKKSKTNEILGCSFEEFQFHLENKFESWMSWNNRGLYNGSFNYGWDIDHIIPLSSAKTEDEIIKLNHYSNLQPLCSYTNRYIKKDNINYGEF